MAMQTIAISQATLEKLDNCSCGNKMKAVFYCQQSTCPQHNSQFLFCESCNNETNHNHLPKRIDTECTNQENDWKKILDKAEKKRDSSINNFKLTQKLLEYFEKVAQTCGIELDVAPKKMLDELKTFCEKLNYFVNEED